MADVTRLINALQGYSHELDRHNARVSQAYAELQRALERLNGVYEGVAAREFKAHWSRTTRGLKEYSDGSRAIRRLLEERLAALKAADRATGL
jgi:uncharacterized protein YukE